MLTEDIDNSECSTEIDGQTLHSTSDEEDVSKLGYLQSMKRVLSNKNWTIYLITVWVYSSMSVLGQYYTLYLRDIGIDYVFVGVLISLMLAVNLIGAFISGYLADNYDRRLLSAVTMIVNGLSFFLLAFVTDIWLVALALLISGLSAFTGTAGQAYHMEQVDRRFGGIANSLFTLGTAFGLVPLYVISVLFDFGWSFVSIMRLLMYVAGMLYMIAALIRVIALKSLPKYKRPGQEENVLRDFLGENIRGLKLLFKIFPVFVLVIGIDAFSDAFYRFASMYYLNETLAFGMYEINLMILITMIISVPLTLILGRVFDKHGGRRLTIVVYAIMPVAIILLIVAQSVPYIVAESVLNSVDSVYPGLSIVFSLAFIATAIKTINDTLWFSVLVTYIQKSLPRPDLGKMLSLTTVVVLMFVTLGPIPAGIIYDLYQGLPLLLVVLILNIMILGVLITKSIEPKISVDDLEAEYENNSQ